MGKVVTFAIAPPPPPPSFSNFVVGGKGTFLFRMQVVKAHYAPQNVPSGGAKALIQCAIGGFYVPRHLSSIHRASFAITSVTPIFFPLRSAGDFGSRMFVNVNTLMAEIVGRQISGMAMNSRLGLSASCINPRIQCAGNQVTVRGDRRGLGR